jgi:hypothetical protein
MSLSVETTYCITRVPYLDILIDDGDPPYHHLTFCEAVLERVVPPLATVIYEN